MRPAIKVTNLPTLPANSQYVQALDSTKRLIVPITSTAARGVPSVYRHLWSGGRVRGTLKPTGQTITVSLLLLTDPSLTTNSAWEVDTTAQSAGVITITSGTTGLIDWLPRTNDWAVEILAGATAPTAIAASLSVFFDPTPAV